MSILRNVTETVAHVMPDRVRGERIAQYRFLGQPVDRLDGHDKVTGAARFSAEYPVENLAHAALVLSTIPKGIISAIETRAAERAPGVIKVITHENAPEMKVPAPMSLDPPSSGTTSVRILNTDRIAWNGQPVALVVAGTPEQAVHAASLVRLEYKPEAAVTSFEASIPHARKPKNILGEPPEVTNGDPDAAFQAAPHRVDLTFTTPPHNHNAIELHAAIAIWHGDDRVTIYDTSQFTAGTANSIAEIFGLKPENVQLISTYVGGGFGGKGGMWSYNQLCVLAARVARRPVRMVLSREDVFRTVGGRTPSQQRVAIAADASGRFPHSFTKA